MRRGKQLVAHGPYLVRHSSYVGSALKYLGVLICHFGPGSWYRECIGWESVWSKAFTAVCVEWSLLIPVLLMARVNREDNVLKEELGAKWEVYAANTPYRLVPFVY